MDRHRLANLLRLARQAQVDIALEAPQQIRADEVTQDDRGQREAGRRAVSGNCKAAARGEGKSFGNRGVNFLFYVQSSFECVLW